jgi:hypothetical protein
MPIRFRPLNVLAALAAGVPLAFTGGVAAAAPAMPSPASCTPTGTGQIDVYTDSVWGVTSTDIRDAQSGKVWTLNGDAVGAPYDATLTGLRADQQYSLQFRYTDSTGTSDWSAPCPAVYARPSAGNLVLNPSGDLGLSYWHAVNASLALASGGSPGQGDTSIRVARTSGSAYSLTDAATGGLPTVPSAEPGSYEAAAWVKASSPSAVGKPVTMALRDSGAPGAPARVTTGRPVLLTTEWKQVWVTAAVQAKGDTIGIRVQQGRAGAGDAMVVDDVRVHPAGSLFSLGSATTARTIDPDVKRATAKDMMPCSEWAEFWINCEVEHDLTSYAAYVDGLAGGSGSASIRGVIYADTGNGPGQLIASTRSVAVNAGQKAGWVDLPLSAPVELGSQVYWFGYQVGGASKVVRFYGDTVPSYAYYDAPSVWNVDAYSDGASSSFGAGHDGTLNTMVRGTGGR